MPHNPVPSGPDPENLGPRKRKAPLDDNGEPRVAIIAKKSKRPSQQKRNKASAPLQNRQKDIPTKPGTPTIQQRSRSVSVHEIDDEAFHCTSNPPQNSQNILEQVNPSDGPSDGDEDETEDNEVEIVREDDEMKLSTYLKATLTHG
jgi:hypothetical protein